MSPRIGYRKYGSHNEPGDKIRRTTVWMSERDIAWLKEHGGIAGGIRKLIKNARIGAKVHATKTAWKCSACKAETEGEVVDLRHHTCGLQKQ